MLESQEPLGHDARGESRGPLVELMDVVRHPWGLSQGARRGGRALGIEETDSVIEVIFELKIQGEESAEDEREIVMREGEQGNTRGGGRDRGVGERSTTPNSGGRVMVEGLPMSFVDQERGERLDGRDEVLNEGFAEW
jgi:hypothetical protein